MNLLETVRDLTLLILVFSCFIYRRQLKLTKWKRKLTKGEMAMYLITSIALPIYAMSYLLIMLEVE